MRNFILVLIAVLLLSTSTKSALAACDEPYGICMSECATSNSAERCMQRCRQSLDRCSKSGVFQMPLAYKWREPSSFSAHAESPWFQQRKRKGSK